MTAPQQVRGRLASRPYEGLSRAEDLAFTRRMAEAANSPAFPIGPFNGSSELTLALPVGGELLTCCKCFSGIPDFTFGESSVLRTLDDPSRLAQNGFGDYEPYRVADDIRWGWRLAARVLC